MAISTREISENISKVLKEVKSISGIPSKLIIPAGVIGIAGIRFSLTIKTESEQVSSVPRYVLESRQTIAKNICQKPLTLTLSAMQIDYNEKQQDLPSIIQDAIENTLNYSRFATTLTDETEKIYRAISKESNIAEASSNILGSVAKVVGQFPFPTPTGRLYAYLTALQNLGVVILYASGYRFYDNMVIESIRVTDELTTKTATDFLITLVQVNFANTQSSFNDSLKASVGVNSRQPINIGTKVARKANVKEEDGSFLYWSGNKLKQLFSVK